MRCVFWTPKLQKRELEGNKRNQRGKQEFRGFFSIFSFMNSFAESAYTKIKLLVFYEAIELIIMWAIFFSTHCDLDT